VAKQGHISKPRPSDTAGRGIPAPSRAAMERPVTFSFEHFDGGTDDFSPRRCNRQGRSAYIEKFCQRLKEVCRWKMGEFIRAADSSLKVHPICWNDVNEKHRGFRGISGSEQLKDAAMNSARQFSISGNKYGRVHGFTIDEVFYIVWLDPEHQLYRGNK